MDEVLPVMRVDVQLTWPHVRERVRSMGYDGLWLSNVAFHIADSDDRSCKFGDNAGTRSQP
jgi:hypothetical protein